MELTGYRALVVDDERYVRELTARALSHYALQCDTAIDGEEGLLLASRYGYDVVLTDLRMPGRNGHALATELLSWIDRPKVIVLTGLQEPRLINDLKRRGVEEVLQKPIDFDLLAHTILSHVDSTFLSQADADGPQNNKVLAKIERSLVELTEMFADRLEGLADSGEQLIEPPTAVEDYIRRLEEEESLAAEKSAGKKHSSTPVSRTHNRARVKSVALATPVTRHFVPCGQPFSLAVRDVSESGVRLLHTRATNAEYLALKWGCQTIPFQDIEVVGRVMRCQPLSRFYDYGCQFVLAD